MTTVYYMPGARIDNDGCVVDDHVLDIVADGVSYTTPNGQSSYAFHSEEELREHVERVYGLTDLTFDPENKYV